MKAALARLENLGYMVGLSMDKICEEGGNLWPPVERSEVTQINLDELPPEYFWSLVRVRSNDDWHGQGVYLLIPNFEESEASKKYFTEIDNKPEEERA
tara:strand:+ start:483 stop:776 length:294 start_codon:yes stop_codon:yes gene_type:complete